MDISIANKHLGLKDEVGETELRNLFKNRIKRIKEKYNQDEATAGNLFSELLDISDAYNLIADSFAKADDSVISPLIIFTDASLREDKEKAAFSIIVRDLNKHFKLPIQILEKYQIRFLSDEYNQLCVMSGEIVNFDVHATEMMAVVAGLEIFSYSVMDTPRPIVFYTDSLVTKKVLGDKRLPPNSKKYAQIRKYFMKLISDRSLNVVMKKVKAHSGIKMNEIADLVAKKRLFDI